MKTITYEIENIVKNCIKNLAIEAEDCQKVSINPTNLEKFGDYQTNIAMIISKKLKKNPYDIALDVKNLIEEKLADIATVEVVKPGFINFFLTNDYLSDRLEKVNNDEKLGVEEIGKNKTVIIDYSSPNAAKPMHIAHIRSAIIGNSIDRLYRFLGYDVIADNHLGDWGVQFGKLIYGYKNYLDEENFKNNPMLEMERLYVHVHNMTKDNPEIEKEAKEELLKLQAKEEENHNLWKKFIDISIEEFNKIYGRLDIKFDTYHGESHYKEMLADVVNELEEKKLSEISEGATVVFLDDVKIKTPMIIKKADGGYNYATTDIATIKYNSNEYKNLDRILYVTDDRQKLHFSQLFAVAEKLGYDKIKLEHITFGLMRMPEGTISTREGGTIKLEDLLNESVRRAYEVVNNASPHFSEEEKKEIAEVVGISAVKYADLSQNKNSIIVFSFDKMLSLEGNTAPYILYSYARIKSIFRKHKQAFAEENFENAKLLLSEKQEIDLAKKIIYFPNIVNLAAETYKPNVIAEYLFELANLYNSFYQNVTVLKADDENRKSRLKLCYLVSKVLKAGLHLLGIKVLEKM